MLQEGKRLDPTDSSGIHQRLDVVVFVDASGNGAFQGDATQFN